MLMEAHLQRENKIALFFLVEKRIAHLISKHHTQYAHIIFIFLWWNVMKYSMDIYEWMGYIKTISIRWKNLVKPEEYFYELTSERSHFRDVLPVFRYAHNYVVVKRRRSILRRVSIVRQLCVLRSERHLCLSYNFCILRYQIASVGQTRVWVQLSCIFRYHVRK